MKWSNVHSGTFTHNKSNKDFISFQKYINGKKNYMQKFISKAIEENTNSISSLSVGKITQKGFQTNKLACEPISTPVHLYAIREKRKRGFFKILWGRGCHVSIYGIKNMLSDRSTKNEHICKNKLNQYFLLLSCYR